MVKIKLALAARTFKYYVFILIRNSRKDIRVNFAFKLILLTSVIIKIIFRNTTTRTFNINSDSFTIAMFNKLYIIIFNKLYIVFMLNRNKRFNNSWIINIKQTIFNFLWIIIKMVNFIIYNKCGKKNNIFLNKFNFL